MTLLELLIKEIDNIGGWPDGAERFFVKSNGYTIGNFFDREGATVGDPVLLPVGIVNFNHMVNVTRERYEAALAASQQPVWDGEGLPPVGVECVLTPHNTRWGFSGSAPYRGVVVAYSGEDFWFKDSSNVNTVSRTDKVDFRTIRTEAERKREAAVDSLASYDVMGYQSVTVRCAEAIYDAIAAGKIPGVKLTNEGK